LQDLQWLIEEVSEGCKPEEGLQDAGSHNAGGGEDFEVDAKPEYLQITLLEVLTVEGW